MTTYHDAHFGDHPARATVWEAIAAHLAPYVAPDARVIEFGAGYCHWINHVRAARRVAVDAWPEMPRHAGPGVDAIVQDLRAGLAGVDAGSFDAVLASNLLEHFEPDDAARVVREACRLLRPGGRFLVIQPNFRYAWRRYFDDYTHRSVFTDVSLPALLRSEGLRVDEVKPRFLPYSMLGSRLPVTRWLVSAYLRSPVKPGAGQMLVIATKEPRDVR